ncbi:MAG: sugar phosphate nucleotidyltransferase [Victivallaceae bacterium]
MDKPTLVLLAAGMGSRYGGLKQLDRLGPCGETIMDYSVFDALRAGFGKVVFVIRRDIETAFREEIGSKYEKITDVDYAFQELDDLPGGFTPPAGRTKPWGTGHAVYAARNVVKTAFAVINADDFYGAYGFKAIAGHFSSAAGESESCICAFVMNNTLSDNGTVSRGVCSVEGGYLAGVTEHERLARYAGMVRSYRASGDDMIFKGCEPVSMNMWGFRANMFERLEPMLLDFLNKRGGEAKSEFYIPFVADSMIREYGERFKMLVSEDSWFGVTYREDREFVQKNIQALVDQGKYPAPLFK